MRVYPSNAVGESWTSSVHAGAAEFVGPTDALLWRVFDPKLLKLPVVDGRHIGAYVAGLFAIDADVEPMLMIATHRPSRQQLACGCTLRRY